MSKRNPPSADEAVRRFQRDMQKLVDKGDMGRVTIRVNDGPEITVAQKTEPLVTPSRRRILEREL